MLDETPLTDSLAGQDATDIFYSLHRHEVLTKPQYQRLIIGKVEGEESQIHDRTIGEVSTVPYGEPTWLSPGYHSPYYTEVSTIIHRLAFQHLIACAIRVTGSSRKLFANSSTRRFSRMHKTAKKMENDHPKVSLTKWRTSFCQTQLSSILNNTQHIVVKLTCTQCAWVQENIFRDAH